MVLGAISPLSAYANENACIESEWNTIEEEKFDILIDEIISIKMIILDLQMNNC